MSFKHTHTITIRHANGNEERIAVDGGSHQLSNLPAGSSVSLFTREETLMELPADWVFTVGQGLTFFGKAEGPFKDATYSVEAQESAREQSVGQDPRS